jgi:serine/threonine protein kinase
MAADGWVPTDDDLLSFDRGLLPEAEADAVTAWLEAHPEGEARLERLTKDRPDPAALALRQGGPPGSDINPAAGLTVTIIDRVLADGPARFTPVTPPPEAMPEAMPDVLREYKLLRRLGEGGMGRVYLARHTRLRRDVAIKLLPQELAADPWYRLRFEREMAVIGSLDHPNLVRAHDAGMEGNYLYLVMELLEGVDVSRLLAERGPLSVADACELVRQAAIGLQCAHEKGTVHRDVKPANLFLSSAGVVKVIDLGLARVRDDASGAPKLSTGRLVMGSPEYLAPEQWDKAAVDHRADIYALGCVLYELLTGQTPYQQHAQGPLFALMAAHQKEPPPSLAKGCPAAPAALAKLVARMLAKAPEQRPDSARAIAEELAAFTPGHDLKALLTPSVQRQLGARPTPVATDAPTALMPSPAATPAPQVVRPSKQIWRVWIPLTFLLTLLLGITSWITWYLSRPGPDVQTGAPPVGVSPVGASPVGSSPAPPKNEPVVLSAVKKLTRHDGAVVSVAFSPNGKVLATGGRDKTIVLWDAASWEPRSPIPTDHTYEVIGLAFSPDGATLASVTGAADTCAIRLWNVATGDSAGTLGGATSGVYGLAWYPDGARVACAGRDKAVFRWDVATKDELPALPDDGVSYVRVMSISPKGDLLAAGGSGPTRVWDAKTGIEIPTALPDGLCPSFLPSGDTIVGWDYNRGEIRICDFPSGHMRMKWRAHEGRINGLTVSPDGRFLASVGTDAKARVWSTADQSEVATLLGHVGSVYAAAFSPDGTRLATVSDVDGTVRIWELPPICHVRK